MKLFLDQKFIKNLNDFLVWHFSLLSFLAIIHNKQYKKYFELFSTIQNLVPGKKLLKNEEG
jgi:hypothetical protein